MMDNTPITILDMEHSYPKQPANSESSKNLIINPNHDITVGIIEDLLDNYGRCHDNITCPCDKLLKHGHCDRGLFIRKGGD